MKKNRFFLSRFLQYLFLSLLLTFSPLYSNQNKQEGKLNFILITIDTLRPDRLSCYSKGHLKTPNIDNLASRGTLFLKAFAHTSTTLPSHTNILLGTTPLYHGVHENSNFIVRDEFLTLAEHLKNHGYSTAAFVGAYPLDSRFGLAQGFDVYDDNYDIRRTEKREIGERKAEVVVKNALEWLNGQKSPWFLWIHCWDPHDPYEPPEPYKTQYEKHPYDGEVAYVDFVLGKLFLYLKENNLSSQTMIIFTGDHGESLGEHDEKTHGFFAYNSTIWIPLIISVPGIKTGEVHQNVMHVDVFPTVCDVLKIEKPSCLQGISLLPALKGKKLPERNIYFESLSPYYSKGWAPLRGYIYGKEKFIESPIPELYNLEKDFNELENLAKGEKLDKYKNQLNQIIRKQSLNENIKAEQKIDRESLEILKSLGYVSSSHVPKKESYSPDEDVKVLLPYHYKCAKAMDVYYKDHKFREGIELLKEVITGRKDISTAYTNLSDLYRDQGRLSDALETLKIGLGFIPTNYEILSTYVQYLVEAGQDDEAIEVLAAKSSPQMEYDPEIWNYIGLAYWHKENFEKALKAFEKSTLIDNKYPIAFNNLGALHYSIFLKTKDLEAYKKSLQNFKRAVELDPYYSTAFQGLGVAYAQVGDLEEAISCLEKALELRPDFGQAIYDLGIVYMKNGETIKAYDNFIKVKASPYYQLLSPGAKEKLDILIQKTKPK
jgi:arylsulfatase A-like enzyme/Tfp pilus assembly protein PilF